MDDRKWPNVVCGAGGLDAHLPPNDELQSATPKSGARLKTDVRRHNGSAKRDCFGRNLDSLCGRRERDLYSIPEEAWK